MYVIETKSNFLYGPFKTAKEAANWADKELTSPWSIRPVSSPNE